MRFDDFLLQAVGVPWVSWGREYAGFDCYGAIYLAYRDVLGITIPKLELAETCQKEQENISRIFKGQTQSEIWHEVLNGDARAFDVAVFRRAGLETHAALICEPGRMLHITDGQDSAIVDYTAGRWAPRLSAVYRHELVALWGADGARDAAALAAALNYAGAAHGA